ncbi:unnamed protein product [Didymodactylos carnosus]|uniref:Uncharacterized protein n=1 Tax=Didymodactylos carnosus TaxID=1234261 RepID=A0A8S2IP00_9BILA|nr:unnamed protein product [Didymodactylos carnosus]CAF3755518.1 unnamed protein product [Didymodactylos carnosus]
MVVRQTAMKSINDITFLYRTRRPPQSYTMIGEINGLIVCIKEGTVPPMRLINPVYDKKMSKLLPSEQQLQDKELETGNSPSNCIWEEGAKAIAEALKINSTLTSVDMGYSSTSEEGAKALEEGLKMNLTLTSLAIGIHTISKEVVQAVEEALKINTTLRSLFIDTDSDMQSDQIVNIKLQSIQHHLSSEDSQLLAEKTHGFNGADLQKLCRQGDFENALSVIKSSSMRDVLLEILKVKWSHIGDQQDLKQKIEHMIVWPIKDLIAFKTMSISPTKGILMYETPGCSKTVIAKAVAIESGLNFFAVNKTSDGNCVLAQLLNGMDGTENVQGVAIIAARNRPDCIDLVRNLSIRALIRPG